MPVRNRAKLSASLLWPCAGASTALLAVLGLVWLLASHRSGDEEDFASRLVLTTRYSLAQMRDFAAKKASNTDFSASLYGKWMVPFDRMVRDPDAAFDVDADDVLVFLHIQKTAGTSFERFLVNHLNTTRPCLCRDDKACNGEKRCKKCKCFRPRSSREFWLFSRYSTGWVCGLHADFTELFVSRCVEKSMDKVEGRPWCSMQRS